MTSPRLPVFDRRRSGVLLHLSSLEAGLGRGGRAFVDWLAEAGFTVWQFLPLGPTGSDGSPYWVRSDSAGNAAFLDPNEMPATDSADYQAFLDASRDWLDDYACFEALSALHGGEPWWTWPAEYRDREPAAMERVHRELGAEIERLKQQQFAFAWQCARLREYAHSRGIRLFGDLPFYVAPDSAETWAHPDQFQLDGKGRATAVAGVPPDYFSDNGQLWGNPLYDWRAMRYDKFAFWRARVQRQLARVDLLRIDHFRALAAHWSVPAGAPDARGGTWKRTPGRNFLRALRAECGDLPIVAEDLGVITEDVDALRKDFALPGMRVLQFGFGGNPEDPHLPHMFEHDCIVYTGTHDNDTTLGWYLSLDSETQRRVDFYLRVTPGSMPEAMVRAALGSVGKLAILPVQDVLGLGTEARLNKPGTVAGNWTWRLPSGALTSDLARHYALLNRVHARV
ncbi:MAG TPA: 4-alpha-glucanotransferase [Steroidobacteraceae bacterium]|nr:4-alpha-glucanotransferase [Steroidobacteraceae bacterium]